MFSRCSSTTTWPPLVLFQYLEERFGKSTRTIASVAFSVQTVLRTALVLYAVSLAVNAITGVSQTASMVAVGVLCTFYSTVGGIKAVVVTDFFQVSSCPAAQRLENVMFG